MVEKLELTNLQKQEIWQRQKGMCGYCGLKFENFDDASENHYIELNHVNGGAELNLDDLVMLCKQCNQNYQAKQTLASNQKKFNYSYGNFENYTSEQIINDLKPEVNEVINFAENATDYREAKSKLRDTAQLISKMKLEKELTEEMDQSIRKTLENIDAKHKEENEKLEQEHAKNYGEIKVIVDEALEFAKNTNEFRQAREKLITSQNKLNEFNLKREHREAMLSSIRASFEDITRRQDAEREKYEMECSENYLNLKNRVEEAVNFARQSESFRQAREKLIQTQKDFKGLRLKPDQREDLFKRIQETFDEINLRQDNERKSFENEANENYLKVKPVVDEAVAFAENSPSFRDAREKLIATQGIIKDVKLKKEIRDELYAQIRKVFDELNAKQAEDKGGFEFESTENHKRLNDKIDETINSIEKTNDFALIRDKLIAIQGEVKIVRLKREQRTELFDKIRNAFNEFDVKRKEYRENRKQDRLNKLASILSNLENKISRINESIDRDKESLTFQNEKLNNLIKNNKEEYAIEDTKQKITSIDERIKEKDGKIKETQTRIQEIRDEINTL